MKVLNNHDTHSQLHRNQSPCHWKCVASRGFLSLVSFLAMFFFWYTLFKHDLNYWLHSYFYVWITRRTVKHLTRKAFCCCAEGTELVTIKLSPINNQFKSLLQVNTILKAISINLNLMLDCLRLAWFEFLKTWLHQPNGGKKEGKTKEYLASWEHPENSDVIDVHPQVLWMKSYLTFVNLECVQVWYVSVYMYIPMYVDAHVFSSALMEARKWYQMSSFISLP